MTSFCYQSSYTSNPEKIWLGYRLRRQCVCVCVYVCVCVCVLGGGGGGNCATQYWAHSLHRKAKLESRWQIQWHFWLDVDSFSRLFSLYPLLTKPLGSGAKSQRRQYSQSHSLSLWKVYREKISEGYQSALVTKKIGFIRWNGFIWAKSRKRVYAWIINLSLSLSLSLDVKYYSHFF